MQGKDVGDSYNRKRMGAFALNTSKYTLMRPLNTYLFYIGSQLMFSVAKFWSSNVTEHTLEIAEMAERRVHPVVAPGDLTWDDVLLPSGKRRRGQYEDSFEELVHQCKAVRGDFVYADLHQSVDHCGRLGLQSQFASTPSSLPFLITHGCLWSMTGQCPLTALDQCRAHGWPVSDGEMAKHGHMINWREELTQKSLTHIDVIQMMGDSWSILVQGPWLMFLLAIIEVNTTETPLATLSIHGDDHTEDDDPESDVNSDRSCLISSVHSPSTEHSSTD